MAPGGRLRRRRTCGSADDRFLARVAAGDRSWFASVVRLYYTGVVGEGIDWRHRGDYIAKHGLTPDVAEEAFADPNRLVIDPDPASVSGRSVRIIGWSVSIRALVTVIVLPEEATVWGVNAWLSNSTDQRRYREEPTDVDQ